MPLRDLIKIDTVVIHCADTPNGDSRFGIREIDDWHRERGFKRDAGFPAIARGSAVFGHVGYHRVIEVDGVICTGRSFEEIGAHCKGANETSIGICLVGRDAFTELQWRSLREMVLALACDYGPLRGARPLRIVGHRDLDTREPPKTCPGFDVQRWLLGGMAPLRDHLCERRAHHV